MGMSLGRQIYLAEVREMPWLRDFALIYEDRAARMLKRNQSLVIPRGTIC